MFPMTFTVEINNEALTARMQRVVNRHMKNALQLALKEWHKRFIGRHFTMEARGLYPQYARYAKLWEKKPDRRPLFVTGTLEKQVVNQDIRISGTAHKATARILLGVPHQYRGAELRKRIYAELRRLREIGEPAKWEEAKVRVLRRSGYTAEAKRTFQDLITATAPAEENELQKFVEDYLAKELGKSRPGVEKVTINV